jgi:hypothetical protein
MRCLVAFFVFLLLSACGDSDGDTNTDSGVGNHTQDSGVADTKPRYDSASKQDSTADINDASPSDSEKTQIDVQDSGIEDSSVNDADIVDSDLSDTENEDAKETEEEIITDQPTQIYLDDCEEHYANNKRCPEEICYALPGYNYTKGCPGKEHAHRYFCQSANPPKDDYKYMLICICACADIE